MLVTKSEDHSVLNWPESPDLLLPASMSTSFLAQTTLLFEANSDLRALVGFFDAALAEGIAIRASVSVLEVKRNFPQALYSSRQFQEVGRRRNYYANPSEDAIVMKRSLVSALDSTYVLR
jgi:hypothetical protein